MLRSEVSTVCDVTVISLQFSYLGALRFGYGIPALLGSLQLGSAARVVAPAPSIGRVGKLGDNVASALVAKLRNSISFAVIAYWPSVWSDLYARKDIVFVA